MTKFVNFARKSCYSVWIVFTFLTLAACGPQKNPYAGREPDLSGDSSGGPLGHSPGHSSTTEKAPGYDWRTAGVFSSIMLTKQVDDNYGSDIYADILSHGKPDFRNNPATTAHETLHGIHSEMRRATLEFDAFIYHRSGRGLYVKEPKQNLHDVRHHIGPTFQQLARYNYDLYIIQQADTWPNTLYIFDEWTGFIATAATAIEAQSSGKWTAAFAANNSDPLEGMVEFMYFCSAALLSIKNVDPDYLKTNQQFKAAFAMNMEESVSWLKKSKSTTFWQRSRAYVKFANLQTASDAAPVRAAIQELMGAEWMSRVIGD
jgi:hypothetical protein